MGLLDERYSNLLSPLFRHSPKEKAVSDGYSSEASTQDSEHYYDMADAMERGLARELVADFMRPLLDSSRLWKFCLERSDDRREYRLYCDGKEFLMFAKVARDNRRVDIFMYDPREPNSLFDASRPAFTLSCSADKTEWWLVQERCDHCRHSLGCHSSCNSCRGRGAELLRVKHHNVEVGDGINHCMDAVIPASSSCSQSTEHRFITKMPSWNEQVGSLVLDFKGRKIQASAKNFQLTRDEDEKARVVCQHGKIGNNSFALDFRFPLTVIQAFGMALTTIFWD